MRAARASGRASQGPKSHLFPDDPVPAGAAAAEGSAPTAPQSPEAAAEANGYRNDLPAPPVTNPPWPYAV